MEQAGENIATNAVTVSRLTGDALRDPQIAIGVNELTGKNSTVSGDDTKHTRQNAADRLGGNCQRIFLRYFHSYIVRVYLRRFSAENPRSVTSTNESD